MYEISELEEQVNNINKIRDYIINLQQENKQLKEQLLITQTNEETFRLEMEDITQTLGLDEDTIFDDVKTYARSLKENISCNWKDSCLENAGKIEILENQQKEFIEWLEDKIQQQETLMAENQEKLYFLIYEDEKEDLKLYSRKAYTRRIILEEILQKYKEIIGGMYE